MRHADEEALTSAEKTELDSLKAGPQGGETIPITKELLSWLSGVAATAKGTPEKEKAAAEKDTPTSDTVAPTETGNSLPPQKAGHTYKEEKVEGTAFVKGAGDAHEVDITDVRQGQLGDCYFLAILAAIARAKPDFIKNMVKDNGNGTYTVTFHTYQGISGLFGSRSGQSVVVNNTFWTDGSGNPAYAKKGDTTSTGSPELWVMIIEKAWAQLNGGFAQIEGGSSGSSESWGAVTGNDATHIAPGDLSDADLAKKIEDSFKAKVPVIFHSVSGDDKAKKLAKNGVIGNHEYALNAAGGGKFTLYNPWGSQHLVDVDAAFIKENFQRMRILKLD
jgi:hypothetical protein